MHNARPLDTPPQTPRTPPRCSGHSLRIHGGREGEEQSAHADVELANVSATACVLDGVPQVSILGADGAALPVR